MSVGSFDTRFFSSLFDGGQCMIFTFAFLCRLDHVSYFTITFLIPLPHIKRSKSGDWDENKYMAKNDSFLYSISFAMSQYYKFSNTHLTSNAREVTATETMIVMTRYSIS